MHAVLQWVKDRPASLRTAGAGLKPGGRFFIIEPETEGGDPEINIIGSGNFPTRPGYMTLFRRVGFEVVSAEKKPEWSWPVFIIRKKPA
jgi:hypothetical protein